MNVGDADGEGGWWLEGESVVALVGRHGAPSALPQGLRAVPGPLLLTATRFDSSAEGPFLELALAELARCGSHVGWCRTAVVVDRPDVQRATRGGWGPLGHPGSLTWQVEGNRRTLVWGEAGMVVRGRVRRPPVPWMLPQRVLQRRGGQAVVIPTRLRGLLHPCAVTVEVDPSAPDRSALARRLEVLEGRHLGAVVTGLRTLARPARSAQSLPAPRAVRSLGRAEPAMRERHEVGAGLG